jgi:hypothetical protein
VPGTAFHVVIANKRRQMFGDPSDRGDSNRLVTRRSGLSARRPGS